MSARNPSRARPALMAIGLTLIVLGAFAAAGSAETIGRSAKGRPITAVRVGPASAKRTVMVVGAIHGTELAGRAVTHRLRGVRPPRGVALLIVDDLNPDGSAAGTQAERRRDRPEQELPVQLASDGHALRHLLPRRRPAVRAQVARPGGAHPGVERHARSVLGVAGAVSPPAVTQTPIPFGELRQQEMLAYARRHYGLDSFRLTRPRVIVEHYTASDSFASAYDTFARDAPDVELSCPASVRTTSSTATAPSTSSSRRRSCAGTPSGSTTRPSGSSTWARATARS